MNRIAILLPLALALAACGDKAEQAPADDRRGAEGEVLGGTIGDDMLPLATVTSQSPPLRETPPAAQEGDEAPAAEEAGEAPAQAAAPDPETPVEEAGE